MDSIPPGRLLTLVRPGNEKDSKPKKLRAGVWLQHNDPKIRAAIWLQVAFQAMSSFAKGNPFSFFFGPLFWDPFFFFFFGFFLALQRLARLKCNLEPNCKRISGSLCCSHTPARSVLGFESFAGRGRFLDGRVSGAYQVE